MLIMMEFLKRPVYLSGGGVMKANLETFIAVGYFLKYF